MESTADWAASHQRCSPILLTLDCTRECILGPWRASRTACKQLFRLANSQDALLSVSMPFDSMSDASSCHQPPAAQAAFAFTHPTPSSACALCHEETSGESARFHLPINALIGSWLVHVLSTGLLCW